MQAVPPENARHAVLYDDGVSRQWIYVPIRVTQHPDGPFRTSEDGGENPVCRFFPGWR